MSPKQNGLSRKATVDLYRHSGWKNPPSEDT